jgi:hypothetical protein
MTNPEERWLVYVRKSGAIGLFYPAIVVATTRNEVFEVLMNRYEILSVTPFSSVLEEMRAKQNKKPFPVIEEHTK